ncbi:MAG: hypothetical protein GF398_19125 [Chitinivibrionales bacterium]|nr:hypothetical protein [Chitinivibrionales bacterium]
MSIYACTSCGHIEFESAPDSCPQCRAQTFEQNDNIFTESAEKSKEAAPKHIPSIKVSNECGLFPEKECSDLMVRIGETPHPMEEKHHIRFIDCYEEKRYIGRVNLTPALHPAGCFHIKSQASHVTIVENCNIHGYWMAEQKLG